MEDWQESRSVDEDHARCEREIDEENEDGVIE